MVGVLDELNMLVLLNDELVTVGAVELMTGMGLHSSVTLTRICSHWELLHVRREEGVFISMRKSIFVVVATRQGTRQYDTPLGRATEGVHFTLQ